MDKKPLFPPVFLQSDLAPVDHPQFIPGAPHNLPALRDRLPRRTFQSGVQLISGEAPGSVPGAPGGMPGAPGAPGSGLLPGIAQVFDPHHYAEAIELNFIPTIVSTKFVDRSANRRNLLSFRNNSTTATIRVSFDKDASATSTFQIAPGVMLLFDIVVPQGDVYAQLSAADVTSSLSISFSTIAT